MLNSMLKNKVVNVIYIQVCMNNSLHIADNQTIIVKDTSLECIHEWHQSIPLCSIKP